MRALVLVALAAFLSPAWAQITTNSPLTLSQVSARAVQAKYGSDAGFYKDFPNWPSNVGAAGSGGTAGSVQLTRALQGIGPNTGQVIDLVEKRRLPWASIAKGVGRALPLISTALAVAEIADAIRCRESFSGGNECDEGAPETTVQGTEYRLANYSDPKPWFPNRQGAIDYYAGQLNTGALSYCTYQGVSVNRVTVYSGEVGGGGGIQGRVTWGAYDGTCQVVTQLGAWQNFNARTGTVTQCPSVVVNGVTLVPVKGPDGKCMTNVYAPASDEQVGTKVETWGDKTKAPAIVNDLINGGKPVEHPQPEIDPVPDSVVGPRETTTNPDGSTTIRDTVWDLAPTPDGYGWNPRTIVKDYPPGATIPPPGEIPDGTTTTGSAPKEDPITCGLPNTPACKIDESGTPPPSDPFENDPGSWFDPIRGVFINPDVADTSWSFTFELPTGCSVLTAGPFLTQTVSIDLCQYMPMIHDFMSIVWLMTGVWVCIGMVGRTLGAT